MAPQQDNTPASSHGPLNPSLHKKAEKYCITCGDSNNISLCSGCKGVWYCGNNNKKCQRADWPCHKLLCSKYANPDDLEPLENAYRGFLFRADSLKPEVVILSTSSHMTFDMRPVSELLRQPTDDEHGPSVERCGFGFSCRLNGRLIGKHSIQILCRGNFQTDGSKANKSILASVRAIGATCPPSLWGGSIVVRRITPSDRPSSATMADFRHTIDWLAVYPKHQLYEPLYSPPIGLASTGYWKFKDIKGVMIAGDLLTEDDSKRYKAISVPYDHMIRGLAAELRGDISPISERIGRPLRLCMMPTELHRFDANRAWLTCTPAAELMRRLKKDTDNRSPLFDLNSLKGCAESGAFPLIGALVISAEDQDLSVNEVRAMVHFTSSMCRELFQKVTLTPGQDTARLEAAMQEALDLMTWDNYLLAFDELGMPRPERRTEAAFIDMRGIGIPDTPVRADVEDGQGIDEEDYWTESEEDSEGEIDS
ncbi:hypothetical protein KVR01_006713 [Diaporthe batatas]|uniref:uncharacterized protein n=1 Tax=Diaporthe batatas TaxID=748121 RepID=UPI001D04D1FA|nr:uncharacterized protein KVR01_006713 [Diaporthe batatas]KAG8163416.1 hypothetical protein KVR01_006713 [Diaporthe batatas]